MFPLASRPNAIARELAIQIEDLMPVPAGLNLVTNAQSVVVEGVPKASEVRGKSGEFVLPAT
jgi:hypothetical protein